MIDDHAGLVGLVMIARDEERCIVRALESCREHVDEMVVVDTGSSDRTIELAAAAGARVSEFSWADDFALAKNVALDRSTCAWRFVLDADEWVSAGGSTLRSWCAQFRDVVGTVEIHNSFMLGDRVAMSIDRNIRLVPAGVRFAGRVHERPQSLYNSVPTRIIVSHDGYLPEQSAKKVGRNEALLRMCLRDDNDAFLHFQLGQDLEVQDRYVEAADCYSAALGSMNRHESWRHAVLHRAIYCYGRAGRFRDGLDLYQRAAEEWPRSPDVHFAGGGVLLESAVAWPDLAGSMIELARRAWQTCLDIGERPDLEGTVTGRGSVLAAQNLAVIDEWWSTRRGGADKL